jgi:hypothetical protein
MNAKSEGAHRGAGAGITSWGEVDSGNNPITNPPCPNCGSNTRRLGPGSGPHFKRIECDQCGRWLRWLPRPREDAHE